MPALPPPGRQPPLRIKLRTRHGPGWKGKEMFQLGPQTKSSYRPCQRRQTEKRQAPGPTGQVGRALPQMVTWGPSVCRQTGRMRPEQQWPRPMTSTPRRVPGNVLFMPGEGAQSPQKPGLGSCQRLHLMHRTCGRGSGHIPVSQENEIKILN